MISYKISLIIKKLIPLIDEDILYYIKFIIDAELKKRL